MRDVIYLLITLVFFAICVGLITACDQVIGPDDLDDLADETVDASSAPELATGVTR